MARVKRGTTTHARHKKVLEQSKGSRGRTSTTFRAAKQRLEKSLHTATKTCLTIVPGAEHNEEAWRARLPAALEFLLGNGGCTNTKLKKSTSPP